MSHTPCGPQESAMGSVVCSTRSKHGNRIPACRAKNHMDDLSLQIAAGLPLGWVPAPQPFGLPDHAVNLYSASNGSRRLMFILVKGPLTSAMPLISANAKLRSQELRRFGYLTKIQSHPLDICLACRFGR